MKIYNIKKENDLNESEKIQKEKRILKSYIFWLIQAQNIHIKSLEFCFFSLK